MGLAIVGSVTFLVQRERVIQDVDHRLDAQVEGLRVFADPATGDTGDGTTDPADGAATASEIVDIRDFDDLDEFMRSAVATFVPARNEGAVGVIDGVARYKPGTLSGFDVSDDDGLIARAVDDTADGETVKGTAETDAGSLRYIAVPVTMEGDDRRGLYIRAVDIGAELEPVTLAMTTYMLAAAVVLAAIGIVGWFVTGRLLSPIRHMRETAGRHHDHRPLTAPEHVGQRRHLRPLAHGELDARSHRGLRRCAAPAPGRRSP